MNKFTTGELFAEIVVGKKIITAQPFKIFSQRTGQTRFFSGAFAVGKQEFAVLVADMNRVNIGHRVEPRGLFNIKTKVNKLLLHGFNG